MASENYELKELNDLLKIEETKLDDDLWTGASQEYIDKYVSALVFGLEKINFSLLDMVPMLGMIENDTYVEWVNEFAKLNPTFLLYTPKEGYENVETVDIVLENLSLYEQEELKSEFLKFLIEKLGYKNAKQLKDVLEKQFNIVLS